MVKPLVNDAYMVHGMTYSMLGCTEVEDIVLRVKGYIIRTVIYTCRITEYTGALNSVLLFELNTECV